MGQGVMSIDGRSDYDYRAGARLYFPQFESIPELWSAARVLEAMREPSLASGLGTVETYRFLWLRTRHQPITVRVQLSSPPGRLVARLLDGKGGYDPGLLKTNVERELTGPESSYLKQLLEATPFLRLPVTNDRIGLDGAFWILEGRRPGGHHVVIRWSPTRHPDAGPDAAPFSAVCEYMLRLCDLGPDAEPIY